MTETNATETNLANAGAKPFRRHKFLSYQGYAFPWYATLIWISFVVGGILYFVKNVLLR